jgi:hypothetical protein
MTDSDQPQRFCTQCGAQVRSGTAFCSSCGAPLTTSTGSSEDIADDSPPKSAGPGLGAAVQALPNRAREFWSQLDKRVKWGLLGVLLIGLLALLSPIAKWISIVALMVSVVVLIVQAVRREPLKVWGILSATLLILVLAFSGLSSAVYGGGLFGGSD